MNLFWLHLDPATCAAMMCDKHVVKIILEACQLLWCAHHQTQVGVHWIDTVPPTIKIYKNTHTNHPVSIWVRKTVDNYLWTAQYAIELCIEYTLRYGKVHRCTPMAQWLFDHPPPCNSTDVYAARTVLAIRDYPFQCTPPPLAMDPECHRASLVESYRVYYIEKKSAIVSWKSPRTVPAWFTTECKL
jgi:hypothetical protein